MEKINELKNLPFSKEELDQKIDALPDLATLRAQRGKGKPMSEQDIINLQQRIDDLCNEINSRWGKYEN